MMDMKDKDKQNCNENDRAELRLMVKSFTEDEKKAVSAARKKLGVDRPILYHNAIVKYVNDVNGGQNA